MTQPLVELYEGCMVVRSRDVVLGLDRVFNS